jgi:hypothetical protein
LAKLDYDLQRGTKFDPAGIRRHLKNTRGKDFNEDQIERKLRYEQGAQRRQAKVGKDFNDEQIERKLRYEEGAQAKVDIFSKGSNIISHYTEDFRREILAAKSRIARHTSSVCSDKVADSSSGTLSDIDTNELDALQRSDRSSTATHQVRSI